MMEPMTSRRSDIHSEPHARMRAAVLLASTLPSWRVRNLCVCVRVSVVEVAGRVGPHQRNDSTTARMKGLGQGNTPQTVVIGREAHIWRFVVISGRPDAV